ncbi:MAG: ribosome maturation factor RimM [Clostridiales bacterium]|nr:ribosome maturation factor RimM [Clostridiales bacterium]
MANETLRIGVVTRPHGVRGAVRVTPLTDDSNRYAKLREAILERHGDHVPVSLSVLSVAPNAVLLKLDGYDSIEQAETLRNAYLCVPREKAVPLPAFTYFVADLIGCEVSDTGGKHYGKITDVLVTGANDIYEIEGGKLLVPALKKVLSEVDTKNKRMVLHAEILREVGCFAD